MTQSQINDAIYLAFENLSYTSENLYDYWVSELYSQNGDCNLEMWTESTLKLMEDDVMNQRLTLDEIQF